MHLIKSEAVNSVGLPLYTVLLNCIKKQRFGIFKRAVANKITWILFSFEYFSLGPDDNCICHDFNFKHVELWVLRLGGW